MGIAAAVSAPDRLRIVDLALHVRIGVTDGERAYPQRTLLSAELGLDTRDAGRTGLLELTVDYSELAELYCREAEEREWVLLEELLEHLAELTLNRYGRVEFARLLIKKFVVPRTSHVSIEVTRSRSR